MKRLLILTLVAATLLGGCSGRYTGVSTAEVLSFQSNPTYGNLYAVAEEYARKINDAVEADTLYPGMFAEYGVTLALMGHSAEAERMFNAEVKAFAESAPMVERLRGSLIGQRTTEAVADSASLTMLRQWTYSEADARRRLASVASVIDSSDSVRVMMQTPVDSLPYTKKLTANQKRQMLEEQQAAAAKMRQAQKDSIAAVKQAKIDARKQQQADKEKAKKEKEKAKKAAEKEKKKAAAAKKKQKAEEQRRKAAERRNKK